MLVILLFYLILLLIQLYAHIATFLSNSALFMNPAIAPLSTIPLLFMLLATISLLNLL